MFDLLILDVDGVMTDGTKTVNEYGYTVFKRFNDRDWTAIKKFKACGIPVVAISGDPWNKKIFENRNIPFYCSKKENGILDKKQFIPILEKEYNVNSEEMAFVFDDFFDLDLAREVGFVFCPRDANTDVLEFCLNRYMEDYKFNLIRPLSIYDKQLIDDTPYISIKNGGEGCIDDLFYVSINNFGLKIPDFFEEKVRVIDSKEK